MNGRCPSREVHQRRFQLGSGSVSLGPEAPEHPLGPGEVELALELSDEGQRHEQAQTIAADHAEGSQHMGLSVKTGRG